MTERAPIPQLEDAHSAELAQQAAQEQADQAALEAAQLDAFNNGDNAKMVVMTENGNALTVSKRTRGGAAREQGAPEKTDESREFDWTGWGKDAKDSLDAYKGVRPDANRANGKFASAEKAAKARDNQLYDSTLEDGKNLPGVEKNFSTLVMEWAEAEDFGDKTHVNDIIGSIIDRLDAEKNLSEDRKEALLSQMEEMKDVYRDAVKAKANAPSQNGEHNDSIAPDPVESQAEDEQDDHTSVDNELAKAVSKAVIAERDAEMKNLNQLRTEYLTIVAGRSRRAVHFSRKFSKGALAEAETNYKEALNRIMEHEMLAIGGMGFNPEDPNDRDAQTIIAAMAFGEQRNLAKELHKLRLEATGNFEIVAKKKDGFEWTEVEQVNKGIVGRTMNKFYNWFGSVNPSGKLLSKGGLQKAAVMGGLGIATGVAFAPFVGGAVAGIGGGLLLSRITKAYMSTRINRKAEDTAIHADARLNELLNELGDGTGSTDMTELIGAQTNVEVRRNRRRTALGMGALAVGLIGTDLVAGSLIGDHHSAAGGNTNHPNGGNTNHTGGSTTGSHETGASQQFTLAKGETIWGDTVDYAAQHGVKLTDEQTYRIVNSILKQNNLTWAQARDLPVGFHWSDNPAIMELLNGKK